MRFVVLMIPGASDFGSEVARKEGALLDEIGKRRDEKKKKGPTA